MGFTYNEPVDIAVTEAVQKAVESMVIEGVKDHLWQLKNPADTSSAAFINYIKETNDNKNKDYMGRPLSETNRKYSVNINAGGMLYSGDYPNSEINAAAGLKLRYAASPNFFLELSLGRGTLSAQNTFKTEFDYADIRGVYYFLSGFNVSPYVLFGGGILSRERINTSTDPYPVTLSYANYGSLVWGGGIEYKVSQLIGISFELNNHYILNDKLDNVINGKYYDYFWNGNLGLNFYF